MKFWTCVLVVFILSMLSLAQDHSSHMQAKPATLVTGLGDLHHPVSTKNRKRRNSSIRDCATSTPSIMMRLRVRLPDRRTRSQTGDCLLGSG